MPEVTIGVIGGSGLYSLFDPADSDERIVATPYGEVTLTVGEFGGKTVAFVTRHGRNHSFAPHQINFRANIWALASLGVRAIVSSSAVGGLRKSYPPGTLVVTDQFIDRTSGRADTFFDQGSVQHLPSADPFCPRLRAIARGVLAASAENFRDRGTVVVIQGPRFSTRAESHWFTEIGGDIINMTMYPEVTLAAELNVATVNLSFVTDSDAGAETDAAEDAPTGLIDPDAVSGELVLERLAAAQPRIVAAIEAIVRAIPDDYQPRQLIAPDAVASVLARSVG